MAASAYVALASLTQVLEQIQHPARHRLHFDRRQIETLGEMVPVILHFLEDNHSFLADTDEADFTRMVANFASEAEDVIHSKVVDQLSQRSAEKADFYLASFTEDMDRVIQKFKFLKESSVMIKEKLTSTERTRPSLSLQAAAGSSTLPASYGKNTMVGFDDHVARIKDRLTGGESGLQIVPIVGMGGIGKTTLAQNIFHDPCFKKYYDISIWFTISQEYRVADILVGLLGQVGEIGSNGQNIAELGKKLYKKLFGRRYLIVLDDVWSTNLWDDLKIHFPDQSEGSRIIVTTRLSGISDSLGNENSYAVDLLDNEKSWELLSENVFGKVGCPDPKLEEIGRRIANDCKGLPLAIVVIGGLLSKSNLTLEKWEEVARKVNSTVYLEANELCLNILSLSYNHLPIHLKPCFLYMRVFPEDSMIDLGRLIGDMVGEGFVISKGGKTLEEVAKEYLEDLIAGNLFLVDQCRVFGGEIRKTIGVHDLLRDLCLREHQKERVLHLTKVYRNWGSPQKCHLCRHRDATCKISIPLFSKASSSETWRMCDICGVICPRIHTLRWAILLGHPYLTRMREINLNRPLASYFEFTSLPLFWNLETLVFIPNLLVPFPSEVWEMPQLRHVRILGASFDDPPETPTIMEKLESLGILLNFRWSEEILERIPNLKKLEINYLEETQDFSFYLLHNLKHLSKLESLTFYYRHFNVEMIVFPSSLRKLNLGSCEFSWEEMTIIGSLPNLEVLLLGSDAFRGEEWNPVEGGFPQLKRLSINRNYLVHWNAEKDHFPKLESLELCKMPSLKKIPLGFGEIETLVAIYLHGCSYDVVKSAKDIVEEQNSYGNMGLQLELLSCGKRSDSELELLSCSKRSDSDSNDKSYGNVDLQFELFECGSNSDSDSHSHSLYSYGNVDLQFELFHCSSNSNSDSDDE